MGQCKGGIAALTTVVGHETCTIEVYAHETHACEAHAHETRPYETRP
jgi:hypothetical protein